MNQEEILSTDTIRSKFFPNAYHEERFPEVRRAMLREDKRHCPEDEKFPLGDTFVGVEIEIEKIVEAGNILLLAKGFESHLDGSMRDGVEFVSKIGQQAQEVIHYVRKLHPLVQHGGFSFRCGLHVHVNVQNHTLEELYRALLVYGLIEELLFDVSGRRVDNNFCVPAHSAYAQFNRLLHYGHKRDWRQFLGILRDTRDNERYLALNIGAIPEHGTIEFRQHQSTSDPEQIKRWVQLLLDTVQMSKEWKTEELEKEILNLNSVSTYDLLLRKLLPNSYQHLIQQQMEKKMYRGVVFLKESFIGEVQ